MVWCSCSTAAVRPPGRALDGRKGLLKSLTDRVPATITRAELADLVKKHARSAPISANRKLAYAAAFFNWCVHEGIIEANPAQNIRKPARENVRERFHTLDEVREIWAAAGTLGYPFAQLYRLLIAWADRHRRLSLAQPVQPTLECEFLAPSSVPT